MFLYFILFIFIFSPKFAFIPGDISFVISIICILLLLTRGEIIKSFVDKQFTLLMIILMFVYLFIVELIFGKSITSNSYSILVLRTVLEAIIPASVLAYITVKKQVTLVNIVTCFIIVQFVFTIIMLNINAKQFIFEKLLVVLSETEVERSPNLSQIYLYRGFGIGRNYISNFPIVIAYFALYLYFEILTGKFSVMRILLIVMANMIMILNSRTSIIIELIIIVIFTIYFIIKPIVTSLRNAINLKVFFFICILTGVFSIIVNLNVVNNELFQAVKKWVLAGFSALVYLFSGDAETGTFYDLKNMMFLPDKGVHFLFGTAYLPRSDIGYVRYIFYGGIIFSILIYITYAVFFLDMFNKNKRKNKAMGYLITTMAITLPIVHFKGDVLLLNEVVRFFFFLLFYLHYNKVGRLSIVHNIH